MILPVLSSPVFVYTEHRSAKPHLRPPVLALAGDVRPCPDPHVIRADSAPSPQLLRALCELCVKNSSPIHPCRPVPPKTARQNIDNTSPKTAAPRPPLHQNANSRPLFSITCEQFCNYGGGGRSPQTYKAMSSQPKGGLPAEVVICLSFPLPPLLPLPHLLPSLYLH